MDSIFTYSANQEFPKNEIANPVGMLPRIFWEVPEPLSLLGKFGSKLKCPLSRHILSSCECHDVSLCFLELIVVEISNQGRFLKKEVSSCLHKILFSEGVVSKPEC